MMTDEGLRRKERREANANDLPAALDLCRRIRDDDGASFADRLRAVELIMLLKGK